MAVAGLAGQGWQEVVQRVLQDPDQAYRWLAEQVVAEIGPRAAAWVAWLRDTYPDPPAHGIARLASRQASRQSVAVLALAGGGFLAAAVGSFPATYWVEATVVLRIAAAYGHDPTDPRRAGELLTLLRLTPKVDPQQLAEVQQRAVARRALHLVARTGAGLGVAELVVAGLRLRRTRAGRALRMLAFAAERSDQIAGLAHRADRFYRTRTIAHAAPSSPSSSSRNSV